MVRRFQLAVRTLLTHDLVAKRLSLQHSHEAALGSAAPERDELQRVPRDFVELRSLQSSLVSEYLHKDRLILRNAIYIDVSRTPALAFDALISANA